MANRNGSMSRWAAVVLTLFVASLAFAVQWGVVTGKLTAIEKRLDQLVLIDHRVSYLEGRLNGQ